MSVFRYRQSVRITGIHYNLTRQCRHDTMTATRRLPVTGTTMVTPATDQDQDQERRSQRQQTAKKRSAAMDPGRRGRVTSPHPLHSNLHRKGFFFVTLII